MNETDSNIETNRKYYNTIYHRNAKHRTPIPAHHLKLASKLKIKRGQAVLDVACGTGEWLQACSGKGAHPHGVDLSDKAIHICRLKMPEGIFMATPAGDLPFKDNWFDMVSCLGALEHFPHPGRAVREIVRVAKGNAKIVLLVPNADFLTRRLGFYSGTDQVNIREDVRTLGGWKTLFEGNGLEVVDRWKDLHVLSRQWILSGRWYWIPMRALQAALLPVWPLKWQYQVFHLCYKKTSNGQSLR